MRRPHSIRSRFLLLALTLLCATALLGTALTATASAVTPPDSFPDVEPGDDFYLAIETLAERGVIGGFSDGTFRPADAVKRAQFAKMIVGVLDYDVDESMSAPFSDLGLDITVGSATVDNLYPHEYVAVAAAHNITRGVRPGVFSPYTSITRAQMVTMTVRAAMDEFVPLDLATALPSNLIPSTFVSADHRDNLIIAENNGLLHGLGESGGVWDPWRAASRGECAQVLYNLSKLMVGDQDYAAAENLMGGAKRALAQIDLAWNSPEGPQIRVNFEEMLTGAAAQAAGAADGVEVPGDYYIRDQNPRYWTFDVAAFSIITGVYPPYPMTGQVISWDTFRSYREPWSHFYLTWPLIGGVSRIDELWLP